MLHLKDIVVNYYELVRNQPVQVVDAKNRMRFENNVSTTDVEYVVATVVAYGLKYEKLNIKLPPNYKLPFTAEDIEENSIFIKPINPVCTLYSIERGIGVSIKAEGITVVK